jgi:hypothetical protein
MPAIRDELKRTAHRPWPLPKTPWLMAQTWSKLLFMHYRVPLEELREWVPSAFDIDTYDGEAWVAIVPFRMSFVRPHHLPAVPWLSFFPELNVRTYVTIGGKPGVYFFSLDAANPAAVRIARTAFLLPYFNARMTCWDRGTHIDYDSWRTHRGVPPADFRAHYGPIGPITLTEPGTLEHWFTERYALYTVDSTGTPYRAEVHHRQWPVQPAWAEVQTNTMLAPYRLTLIDSQPLLHYAERIKVVAWPIRKVFT